MSELDCVFCAIVAYEAPALVLYRWPEALAIVPLEPVTFGHVIVLPKVHVADYTSDPAVSAQVMARAAQVAPYPSNLITSAGAVATQTVQHLHLHVVPRRGGDGLGLPWGVAA